MKKIYVVIPLILISFPMVFASGNYYVPPKTIEIIHNGYENYTLIDNALKYWKDWGFPIQITNHSETKMIFQFGCEDWYEGLYNETDHLITVCVSHDIAPFYYIGHIWYNFTDTEITDTTEHELGHYLGFNHYSFYKVMHID